MISTSDFQSNSLDQVKNSIERNGIAIKGVIDIPLVSYTGEVQNVNLKFYRPASQNVQLEAIFRPR